MALVLLAVCAVVAADRGAGATTVFVVRHAEKLEEADDPALSPAGWERARALAATLRDVELRALYSSQFRRARETLEPLAESLGLEIRVVPAAGGDLEARARLLARRLLEQHRGESVLVSGHSNTVPLLIESLGASPVPELGHDDYDDLFVVRVDPASGAELLRLHYGPPNP